VTSGTADQHTENARRPARGQDSFPAQENDASAHDLRLVFRWTVVTPADGERSVAMRTTRRRFLTGLGAAAGAAALGGSGLLSGRNALAQSKTQIEFWATPFVSGEVPSTFVKWFGEQQAKDLHDITFTASYGPGAYNTQQSKFLVQARTGTPDTLEGLLENMVAYIKAGIIAPVDDRFNAWPDHTQFLDSTVKGLTFNGRLWGVPYNTNARVMLYRKSILNKHGLKVPTTWDELLETGSAISAKEPGMSGFMCCTNRASVRGPQEWISWYFQLNRHVFSQDPATKTWRLIATPAQFAQVYELYYNLFYSGSPPAANPTNLGLDANVLDNGYGTGKWAMVPEGPWMYAQRLLGAQQAAVINDTGIAPLPMPKGGGHGTYLEIKPVLLNKYSKHPDAAWKGIQYLTSAKIMGEWAFVSGFIPPRKDVEQSARFLGSWWQKGFTEILPDGVYLDALNWAPVFDAFFDVLQTVVYKKATAAQAGTALHGKLSQLASGGML
jgi:multiple sugar transport system substrate-binding protein